MIKVLFLLLFIISAVRPAFAGVELFSGINPFPVVKPSTGRNSWPGQSYHGFEGLCLNCHTKRPRPGEERPVIKRDVSAECKRCHEEQDALSHPIDVRPAASVPDFMPLDGRGMLTCVTCHSVHKPGFGPSHLRARVGGPGFCVLCHSGLDEKMHSVFGVGAHMGGAVKVGYGPGSKGNVRLDEMSIKCMSCHDAILGDESTVTNFDIFRNLHDNKTALTHPIGVLYSEAKRKYRGAYRSFLELPPQIKLYGGRVGCGTCHSPYAGGRAQLVMSNFGSNLCLACHVK